MESDVLTIGRSSRVPPWCRRLAASVVVTAVVGLLLGTSLVGPTGGRERGLLPHQSPNLEVLLLGDSSAGEDSCGGSCLSYTEQLAANLRSRTEQSVTIEDRSWRGNAWPPADVNSVLAYLRTDPGLRKAVRSADLVVLALTESNGSSASDHAAEQLDAVLVEVSQVRDRRPIVLGLVVAPRPGASGRSGEHVTRLGCPVSRHHHGACVDLLPLLEGGLLTPKDWMVVAGRPCLSQHGHDVVAQALIARSGLAEPATSSGLAHPRPLALR